MTYTLRTSVSAFLLFLVFLPVGAFAATSKVSLTFDDGWINHYTTVAPILSAAGQTGTFYIAPGLVGGTFEGGAIMNWSQVTALQNSGFEIGGHSMTHAELPELSLTQMRTEVSGSYNQLVAHGITPKSFATPYGAYSTDVILEIAKYYDSHRPFHDVGYNTWPYNKYLIRVQQITNQTTVAQVQGWITTAKQNGTWLVIVFHEILPSVTSTDTYSWTTAKFQSLINYLEAEGIQTVSVSDAIGEYHNLVPNGDFTSGIASGWVTDNTVQVTADGTTQGAMTSPSSSVKFAGSSANVHLFAPRVTVDSTHQYGIRAFANTKALTAGELGFYVDEYDAAGNWLSWRWLGPAQLNNAIDHAYLYTPSASTVKFLNFNVYLDPGSVGSAFLDAVQIFDLSPIPPPPPPTDMCSNIDGIQSSVPNGYEINGAGDCVLIPPPPVDVCPNIVGVQETIPVGYEINTNGDCVLIPSPPVDVCPNIDGVQTTVPAGYQLNQSGQCVLIPPPPSTPSCSLTMSPSTMTQGQNASLGWSVLNATALSIDNGVGSVASPGLRFVSPTQTTTYTGTATGPAGTGTCTVTLTVVASPPPLSSLFTNSDFTNGIANGWRTDNANRIAADVSGHGILPTANSTVRFSGGTGSVHLFSPLALVSGTTVYSASVFADTLTLTSGELGFYVDEYDTAGNWISGKWLGQAQNSVAQEYVFSYTRSSANVASASLQVYLTFSPVGSAYVDNARIFTP